MTPSPRRAVPTAPVPAPRAAPARSPEDLQRTLADLAALLQSVTLAVHELGRVGGRLRGAADEIGHALGDAWDLARTHGGSTFMAVDRRLFRHPAVAVGAALAIGALAGLALRRAHLRRPTASEPDDGWDHFV